MYASCQRMYACSRLPSNLGISRCKARVLPACHPEKAASTARIMLANLTVDFFGRALAFAITLSATRSFVASAFSAASRALSALLSSFRLPRDFALCFRRRRIEAFLECNERRRWRLTLALARARCVATRLLRGRRQR